MTARHEHQHPGHGPDPSQDALDFWEQKYAGAGDLWSGRPNHALVEEASPLAPGRALDLGCGEGADARWLAARGWTVTGVDLSATAVARADRAARAEGLADRVRWVVTDLVDPAGWTVGEPYQLVTACFLQTPLDFPRAEVLRRAAGLVAPGGRLLVVSHAAPPAWSEVPPGRRHEFPDPEHELADLALDGPWEVEVAELRERAVTGPDGAPSLLLDSVVRARRG